MLAQAVGVATVLLEVFFAIELPKSDDGVPGVPVETALVLHLLVGQVTHLRPVAHLPLDYVALLGYGQHVLIEAFELESLDRRAVVFQGCELLESEGVEYFDVVVGALLPDGARNRQ